MKPSGEAAFETVIEAHLLAHGCVAVPGAGFDRERAVFPETALAFVRETQPKEWARLEALLGARTGAQVLADLCKSPGRARRRRAPRSYRPPGDVRTSAGDGWMSYTGLHGDGQETGGAIRT